MKLIGLTIILGALVASSCSGEVIEKFFAGVGDKEVHLTTSDSSGSVAQQFEILAGSYPKLMEVQLLMKRISAPTNDGASLELEVCADDNGRPSSDRRFAANTYVDNISGENLQWVSFPRGGTSEPYQMWPGKWWIVCRMGSSLSDVPQVICYGQSGNPYGSAYGTLRGNVAGNAWHEVMMADMNFVLYGDARTNIATTTTMTADPTDVKSEGASTITVEVTEHLGGPVEGPGIVDLTMDGGECDVPYLILENGKASTLWHAPKTPGTYNVWATYRGHAFGTNNYLQSTPATVSTSIPVDVAVFTTDTTFTYNPDPTYTRTPVSIQAIVTDNLGDFVNGGKVMFKCTPANGTFSSNPATMSNGVANTTWTTNNTCSVFDVKAIYSGYSTTTSSYGSSSYLWPIKVDCRPVTTTTTVEVSPDYPYIGKWTYVIVKVRDDSGDPVPGGLVHLSTTSGWFEDYYLDMRGGMQCTKWHVPDTTGPISLNAGYMEYLAGGNYYQASMRTGSTTVVEDPDKANDTLNYMSLWISDYTDDPVLVDCGNDANGFGKKLTDMQWGTGTIFPNGAACETYMRADYLHHEGHENDLIDTADFVWYGGHGNPNYITFISDCEDDKLSWLDCVDPIMREGCWGDKDMEWIALQSCDVLSNPGYWAAAMKDLHLECGFVTTSADVPNFGKHFGDFLFKDGIYDYAHPIWKAWFLATEMDMALDKRCRVVAQNDDMWQDHIWGQGYVCPDPHNDGHYTSTSIQRITLVLPTADAGGEGANGDYWVDAGAVLQLDGSKSRPAISDDYLTYAWDLDLGDGVGDGDVFGRRPQVVFSGDKTSYIVTLTVYESNGREQSDSAWVHVSKVHSVAPAQPKLSTGGMEIIDMTTSLPLEEQLPVFVMTDPTVGFDDSLSLAHHFGMDGSMEMGTSGNWRTCQGPNELMVNESTGAIMYANIDRAYEYMGPPGQLPTDQQAIAQANLLLTALGISKSGAEPELVTRVCRESGNTGDRSAPTSTPYQVRVCYQRKMDVGGTKYPVVGAGGKIMMLLDSGSNPPGFLKVCRNVQPAQNPVQLHGAATAIADFQRLGAKALTGGAILPKCNRVEINNISLGYYEAGFSTPQAAIYPVYVLDVTCEDNVGSLDAQVYMSAVAAPVEAAISAPDDETEVGFEEQVTFSGSAGGGTGPYTYEWSSDVDGELGTGATINARLPGYRKEGEAWEHTITLRATDATGAVGVANVHVKVVPNDLGDIRRSPTMAQVWLLGPIVTGIFPSWYYVETPDRSGGIAVTLHNPMPKIGDSVDVAGSVFTFQGERLIQPRWASIISSGNDVPEPLFMQNRCLGGADFGPFAPGVVGGIGLYDIGLLVTLAGRVTYVSPSNDYFIIDDASTWIFEAPMTTTPVKVMCQGFQPPASGSFALVTGISGAAEDNGQIISVLRMRDQTDLLGSW